MRAPASLLQRTAAIAAGPGDPSSSPASEKQKAPVAMVVDSNLVVILASLLCALVCVLGLALVSRCACRRRRSSSSDNSSPPPKGLKKKTIGGLPIVCFPSAGAPDSPSAAAWCSSTECAICLAEFAEGEGLRLRVLPRCGHGFHAPCIDAWLRTCASCPSCRASIVTEEPAPAAPTAVVVVAAGCRRCGRCGEVAAPSAGGGDATPTFLP